VHKFLKYSGLVFILAIILLLFVPFFVPLDKYKEMATEKVKEAVGRQLEINGAMSLSLLPSPEIKIQDIKLSSIPGAHYPSLLEAKELKVSLSLFSLLTGNIVISGIKINEPVINLERMANGSASWEFSKNTPSIKESSTEESSEKKKEDSLSLYINSFKILGAKINYIETNKTGSNTSNITIDNLEIKNFHGPDNLACEFYSTGKGYNIKGNVKEDKDVIVLNTNLDFSKEKINLSGNFDRNNMSFIGKLKLEGDAEIFREIIQDIDENLSHKLTFDISADKKLVKITDIDITFGKLSAKGSSNYDIAPLEPIITALKIEKLLPAGILNKAFSFGASLSYLDQNLLLNDILLNIDKANLNGNFGIKNWDKDLSVSYDLKTNSLLAFASLLGLDLPVNIDDLQIKGETIKAKDLIKTDSIIMVAKTTNIIKGNVILGHTIKPSLTLVSSGTNLGQSLGILLKSTPNTLLGNYSLSTKIDGDSKNIIEIHIDKSSFALKNTPLNITGLLSLNLTNTKPKISANLTIPSLNIGGNPSSDSSPSNLKNGAKGRNPSHTHHWSNDKMDLSFLNTADADITITIQKIIKGELVFDNIKTVLLLSNGVLDLKSLNGNMYGGRLEASGEISSQNNQPAVFKATLKGADLKNIAPQGSKIKVTQGKVNFDTDLKTKGNTQYQYVSNLFGNTKLTASNGKISGFDLQKVIDSLKKIKSLDSVLGMLNSSFSGGETAFKQLDVSTEIKGGIANITQFKLDVPSVDVSAIGNINLPKYTLDINSTVNVDVKSMPPLKVNIYGALDNPEHKLDTRALQQHLIKNVLTNVVDEIKKGKRPEDMLKSIIGGISNKGNSPETSPNNQEAAEPTEQRNPTKDLESQVKKGLQGLFK